MLTYMILKVTSNVYTEGLFKMYFFLKSLDTKGKLALANLSRSSRCFFHREKNHKFRTGYLKLPSQRTVFYCLQFPFYRRSFFSI